MNSMRNYQPPRDLLAGRVILVTGAGDGLGRTASLAYARHGASVILAGRTQNKLEAVYDEILAEQLANPLLMPLDLAKAGLREFEQIAAAIDREFGRLDGLLHSAATLGTLTPLAQYDLETWQKVVQVNLNAAYLLTRACLGVLEKSPDASVIFTTSEMARHGRAYWGAYAAAGAALENLTQVWADELSTNTHIRMNTLDPGTVRSALRARAFPGENPLTLPAPEEVMAQYLYLMGPDSRGITGQALHA
ncbi:MAG: YciK family oxidoreductase [Candidatus Muproteobacteria bacterium RBG_19FT_COMBO_61_10]|uniref:YciK family oxidoreductase n=1 Tax=Candidatus Muproteobacteria bacterium RBG_19FT_COMBO_61_10 TaxID=1817761 RepID=A0A1F6UHX9_9PROT|nr:MAG: YciK family oxidoreductase [Candidatus Muproteobacteria bacterium RBG_19FT_COMBO_61_10]